jgi:hypothetical protein
LAVLKHNFIAFNQCYHNTNSLKILCEEGVETLQINVFSVFKIQFRKKSQDVEVEDEYENNYGTGSCFNVERL